MGKMTVYHGSYASIKNPQMTRFTISLQTIWMESLPENSFGQWQNLNILPIRLASAVKNL